MKGVKEPVVYKSLSVPEPLFNEFKKHVQNNSNYRNMAEFLREAIREKIERDSSSAIKRYSDLLKMMESKGFKKEIRDIRKRGMPDEIGVLSDLDKEIESDMVEQQKTKEHGKKMIDLYQKQKQEFGESHAKEIDDWVLHKLRQNEEQEIKKEPVIQLSKDELTDMIQNVVTETLNKKEKKVRS